MTTIFGRIIKGELPAEKIYEDEEFLVIEDIHPKAPVHLLIIPKKEYPNLQVVPEGDLSLVAGVAKIAQKMAAKYHIENGYRLLTNNGSSAGQTIFHLHFHLLGGRGLGDLG